MVSLGEAVGLIVAVLTAITLLAGLVGLAVRFVLLPWLRDNLVRPVKDTAAELGATDSHRDDTARDQLDQLGRDVAHLDQSVHWIARAFDSHIDWADDSVNHLEDRLDRHIETGHHPHKEGTDE